MGNKSALFIRHFRASLLILIACAASSLAFAQQTGFFPVAPSVNGVRGHAIGDLNNDGRDDLVGAVFDLSKPFLPDATGTSVSGYVNIAVIVSLNATDGSFQSISNQATTLYSYQSSLFDFGPDRFVKQLADINGDGKLDIVLFNLHIDNGQLAGSPRGVSKSVVFYGMGDGTVNPAFTVLALPSSATEEQFSTKRGVFADMNGDNKADYVAPSQTGFNILIYPGDGSGGFSSSPSSSTAVSSPAGSTLTDIKSLVVADMNIDGLRDIGFIADNPTADIANLQSLHVMTASATGTIVDTIIDTFQLPNDRFTKLIAQNTALNGKVALLLTRNSFITQNVDAEFPARAYLGDGQGVFSLVTSLTGTPSVFADFNGDGLLDVLTYAGGTENAAIFRVNRGIAAGGYSDVGTFTVPSAPSLNNVVAYLSGPHRFGVGSTPGVLMDTFNFNEPFQGASLLTPIVTRTEPQKQFTTTSASVLSPVYSGLSFTITATVTATGPTPPSGAVMFKLDSVLIGSANLINGVATIVVGNGTTAGSHQIRADYSGDSANLPSSGTLNINVLPPLPKIVSVSNPTVKEGQKAMFRASLSAATTQTATFTLRFVDVSATGGVDYTTAMHYSDDNGLTFRPVSSSGTATLRAGAAFFLVQVTTLKDNIEEQNETFKLEITPVSNLSPDLGTGTGTILNKSGKQKSLYDQVRSIGNSATATAESIGTKLKNAWTTKSFSGLFAWR